MQTAKEQAAEVLRRLPDDVSMEDIHILAVIHERRSLESLGERA